MNISGLDHLVLTVGDIKRSIAFYTRVLGMEAITFGEGRKALQFGHQKINLHRVGAELEPKARSPIPGAADICFLVSGAVEDVLVELEQHGVAVEEGPVRRTGAQGPINSIYIRDPDGNLIELAVRQYDY
jgi:catechol 2,3-dioxygenase-like lactoylglutathione lyase family enzyme